MGKLTRELEAQLSITIASLNRIWELKGLATEKSQEIGNVPDYETEALVGIYIHKWIPGLINAL